jgi:lyso-ornithine lipid O-acyltransferase
VSGSFAATIRMVLFALVTLALMPVQALALLFAPRFAKSIPLFYHRMICKLLGFRIRAVGALPTDGPCLVVSNHVSWIDIPVLSTLAPMSFVAKREVAAWPLFGWLAKLQRTVFVDRERRHSTGQSRDELSERLAALDRIVLFPEGTSHHGAAVLPFKSSFFAAAANDVVIIPVTLAYKLHWGLPLNRRNRPRFAWFADIDLMPHLWGALCHVPLTVDIIIGEPLPQGLGRKQAAAQAEYIIRETLAAALHGRLKLE